MLGLVVIGLVLVILEEKVFGFGQCIFALKLLFPLGKGHGPSFEQT